MEIEEKQQTLHTPGPALRSAVIIANPTSGSFMHTNDYEESGD
ncbi:MAG TPA: hypothetical protein VGD98_12895 [Ktedonobacteraceae bacterium]